LHERERGREGEQQTRVMDLRDNKLDRLTDKVSLASRPTMWHTR
jgi:hypothetical protein